MKQQNKFLLILGLSLIMTLIFASNSFAYGEQLESSITKLVTWITRVLGGAAFLFGGLFAAFDFMFRGGQALKKAGYVMLGGVIIFALPKIYELIKAIFA